MEILDRPDYFYTTLWYIAIPVTLIFLIQVVMTFVGTSDGSVDADFDSNLEDSSGPFQMFSFRNLIDFLLGFSWGAIAFYDLIQNRFLLVFVAVLIGLSFVAMFVFLMFQIRKLSQDNTVQVEGAIGKTATVYLRIPGSRGGSGKVQIVLQQTTHEMDAQTAGDPIPTGAVVKVTDVIDNHLLLVEKL